MIAGPIAGLGGALLSPRAAGDWLDAQSGGAPHAVATAIAEWADESIRTLGPSAGQRRLLETLEALLACDLGFTCRRAPGVMIASTDGGSPIVLAAAPWGRDHPPRALLGACIDAGAPWALVFNGTSLTIVDARPGAPRRVASLSLEHLAARARTAALAGALLAAPAAAAGSLDAAVRASDGASRDLRHGLRAGVRQAVDVLSGPLPFDAAIAVLFRVLFVLFAEARALVPVWHALYRDHYSLAALSSRRLPGESRGVWASLEAGRRLLGDGCRAGSLHVPAFNGRLFRRAGPRRWTQSAAMDSRLDRPAAEALAALVSYRPGSGGARRVNYAELDVEELGAIYERLIDLDPSCEGRARKESGAFYTPRALTGFLVRRALAPLIDGATSEGILALRVVDPAMGSGAVLVAALRYLSAAVERARVAEGSLHDGDVTEGDRQEIRRLVARRCLYGVDVNPTAVMLAKLSLWLATLAPGRPLTFLDHHLRCGNSLIGIDPERAAAAPSAARGGVALPLFDDDAYRSASTESASSLARLAFAPEDTAAAVRAKEKRFAGLTSPLARWRSVSDLWCAWWFLSPASRPDAREFRALAATLLDRPPLVSRRTVGRRVREAAEVSARERFFHWPLEFPDVFPRGFDAVVGNPPWEMLSAGAGAGPRSDLKGFARGSGVYPRSSAGHLNLYQLFVERALQLARPGGRLGLILPWGMMADEGSAGLRRYLLDGAAIDTLARFDNHEGLFHAHRSLRFVAVTAGVAAPTAVVEPARMGSARALDDLPDAGALPGAAALTREALAALSGPSHRIPDAGRPADVAVAVRLAARHRALGDPRGWGASFGRELHLTGDRAHFTSSPRSPRAMPVLEGKHLMPFRVEPASARHHITREAARRVLPGAPFDRARLAYRDVTAPTNRQTLIAAIVPAGCATGHSLFCLRNDWDERAQRALCAILNSGVANFLIRLFVGAHVTTALIGWLPVPDKASAVDALGTRDPAHVPKAELDAIVAALYGVSAEELTAI